MCRLTRPSPKLPSNTQFAQSLVAVVTPTAADGRDFYAYGCALVVQSGARYVSTSWLTWLLVSNRKSRETLRLSLSLDASAAQRWERIPVQPLPTPQERPCLHARRLNVPAQRLLPLRPLHEPPSPALNDSLLQVGALRPPRPPLSRAPFSIGKYAYERPSSGLKKRRLQSGNHGGN